MSGFMSNKYLKFQGLRGLSTGYIDKEIEGDLSCRGCNYNLRGLKTSGRCPECGMSILDTEEKTYRYLPTVNVFLPNDRKERKKLEHGFGLATICLLVILVLRILLTATIQVPLVAHNFIILINSFLWVIAVYLILPVRFSEYGVMIARIRITVICLQLLWVLSSLIFCLNSMGLLTSGLLVVGWVGYLFAGIGGLALIYLVSLASWDIEREEISNRLTLTGWGLGILGPLAFFPAVSLPWIIYLILYVPIVFLFLIVLVMTMSCTISLRSSVRWTTYIFDKAGAKTERIKETRQEIDDEVIASIRPYPTLSDTPESDP